MKLHLTPQEAHQPLALCKAVASSHVLKVHSNRSEARDAGVPGRLRLEEGEFRTSLGALQSNSLT